MFEQEVLELLEAWEKIELLPVPTTADEHRAALAFLTKLPVPSAEMLEYFRVQGKGTEVRKLQRGIITVPEFIYNCMEVL